ncbi:MAG: hypothetical protein U9N80_08425 [Chloroflexota bacterium]|nr:hypothetical protein [Chloroflexota bacterium]
MNENNYKETRPGPGDRKATFVVRASRFIVRLFFIVLLGSAVGAAAYYGAPALYRNYIEPVQANSQRITDLEKVMKQSQADRRSRAAETGERFAEIEGRQAEQQERFSEMQVETENLQTKLKKQNDEISDLQHLAGRVDALETDLQKTADAVEALEASMSGTDAPIQRLERQLQLVRVMELLTRARLWLIQGNFGLASEDIQAAIKAVENLAESAPEEEADTLRIIIERLNLALQALPYSPVTAADDLEIAWKLIVVATEPPVVASD